MHALLALHALSAVRMVPVDFMKHLWRHARAHFVLCLLTASVCVALDPVVGLLAGTLAAYLIAAMNSSNAPDAVLDLARTGAVAWPTYETTARSTMVFDMVVIW